MLILIQFYLQVYMYCKLLISSIKLLNSKEHNNVALVSHIFLIAGTLIWGYGDFINK